jgi:hypothetical protein
MPTESTITIPVKRSSERGAGGSLSFGEIAIADMNGEMFHGAGVVPSHDERSGGQPPQGDIKGGKEGIIADQNPVDGGDRAATGMCLPFSNF